VVVDGKPESHHAVLDANFGVIEVRSEPVGARISLNSKATGQVTPYRFKKVRAGTVEVGLSLEGYGDKVVRPNLARGAQVLVEESLDPKLGYLSVFVNDNQGEMCEAAIYLDRELMEERSPAKFELPAREYSLLVDCGGLQAEQTVRIIWNEKQTVQLMATSMTAALEALEADLGLQRRRAPAPKVLSVLAWSTAGGFAVAGLVSRGVAGSSAVAAGHADTGPQYQQALDQVHSGNNAMGVAFGVAAASVAGGIVSAIVAGVRSKKTRDLRQKREELLRKIEEQDR